MLEVLLGGLVGAIVATLGAHVLERRRERLAAARALSYRLRDIRIRLVGVAEGRAGLEKIARGASSLAPWPKLPSGLLSLQPEWAGMLPTWLCDYVSAAERGIELLAEHHSALGDLNEGRGLAGIPLSPTDVETFRREMVARIDEAILVTSEYSRLAIRQLDVYCEDLRTWAPIDDEIPPSGTKLLAQAVKESPRLQPSWWKGGGE